jgi:hypothetical protein
LSTRGAIGAAAGCGHYLGYLHRRGMAVFLNHGCPLSL